MVLRQKESTTEELKHAPHGLGVGVLRWSRIYYRRIEAGYIFLVGNGNRHRDTESTTEELKLNTTVLRLPFSSGVTSNLLQKN